MSIQLLANITWVFIVAYLLGAIPFGAIIGKIYGVDLLKKGSGSTGTTNVMRNIGFWPGLFVLIADLAKGAGAAYLGLVVLGSPILVVFSGLFSMLGHSCSIFLGFKGGKAAATGVGVILVISWQAFLMVFAIAMLVVLITRYQSLASLLGAGITPFMLYLFKADIVYLWAVSLCVLFVWFKHIPNIKRLLAGTENKVGSRKRK